MRGRSFRLFASSALLAALWTDSAGAQPAAALPLPIAMTTQQWCHAFSFFSLEANCTSGETHSFSEDDGAGFTVNGSITAQNVDGKLVYVVSGTAINTTAELRYFVIRGQQVISFEVPQISTGGVSLPTTTVAASATADSSELTGIGRIFGPSFPATMSSAILGSNLVLD